MDASSSRPRPDSGFTLLEVLLATTLLSLVVTSLYVAFDGGMRLRAAGRAHLGALGAARRLAVQVQEDLLQIAPVDSAFVLGRDELRLVRTETDLPGVDPGRLVLVHYRLGATNGGHPPQRETRRMLALTAEQADFPHKWAEPTTESFAPVRRLEVTAAAGARARVRSANPAGVDTLDALRISVWVDQVGAPPTNGEEPEPALVWTMRLPVPVIPLKETQ